MCGVSVALAAEIAPALIVGEDQTMLGGLRRVPAG